MTSAHPSLPIKDVALFFVLATITAFPILYFDVLPLHDLPSHMARMAVIQAGGNDAILSQYYTLDWHLIPNLALDIWTYMTAPFVGVDMAVRCFIVLSFLLLTSGTIFVHRALGGAGYWPFISFILIWNEILAWGFLSFLFSIGVAMWLFGAWIRYHEYNIIVRVMLHAVGAAGLLICHLFGFAVYALAVGAYEAGNVVLKWRANGIRIPNQHFWGGVLQFIPALVLFFLTQTSSGYSAVKYDGVIQKIADYSTPILLYHPVTQMIIVTLFVAFVACSISKKWARVPPPCWFILVTGAICTLVAPSMMFNSYFLSHRMPVALSFLFLATIQFTAFKHRINGLFQGFLVAVIAIHMLYVSWHWTDFQLTYRDLFLATQSVKEGDKVLSMTLGTERYTANLRPPLIRAVEFLVPTRKIFSPHILADGWHQPMKLTKQAEALKATAPEPLFNPKPPGIQELAHAFTNSEFHGYDFILVNRMDPHEDLIPEKWVLRERVGQFRLYKPNISESPIPAPNH